MQIDQNFKKQFHVCVTMFTCLDYLFSHCERPFYVFMHFEFISVLDYFSHEINGELIFSVDIAFLEKGKIPIL